ncbi:diguanylate cyclase, partial [Dankookia rubra]
MPARHSRHAIGFVAVALLTVIGIGTALLLDQMRQTARDAADGVVQRAASVVESTVNRLFLQIDGTLASLPGLVGQVSSQRNPGAEEVSQILRSINFQNLNFRDLLLVRPDGVAWASARASSRDRPLPIELRETGPAQRSGVVRIAGPVQNPTTGEWALFFLRPVRLPNLGLLYAAAEVPIPLVVTLLNPAAEVPGLRVAVTRTDGRLLVGLPHDEARLSRQSAEAAGAGEVAPPPAAVAAIVAARPTLYRTIAITVTLDAAAGMTEWQRDRDRLIAVALGASLVVVALALAALLVVQQRERTERERQRARATLESAIESMSDGFVMFDAEDRLVVCNERYRDLYSVSAPFIVPGASFEHIMREGARRGQYPQAGDDLEGFVRDTVTWHHGNHPPIERMLPDGRWLLITERPMPDGGTVGIRTDITAQKQAMRELAIGERRYSALAKAGAIVTWQANAEGTILEAPGWTALTGLPDTVLRDGGWVAVVHPEDQAAVPPNWVAAADADGSVDIEFRILTGGAWRWMRVRGAPVYEPPQSRPLEWVGTIHDVHDRRAAQAALAESEARFVRAISAVGMGTWDWNLTTDVLHLSPGYEALYQKEEGSLPTARAAADATHPDDVADVTAAVDRALKGIEGDSYDIEFRILRPGGGLRWLRMQGRAERDAHGKAIRMSGVTQDVTARHDAEQQLAHMARHDALTDLPNRTMLRERMDAAMADAGRGNASAIFCLDLDRFKQVNDTLGHPVGDALLRAVTARLLGCIRGTDMVARIGGDEFAIVQSSVNQPSDARTLARRIIAEISRPYEIEGNRIVIGTSLGIAIAPQDGIDSDRLLR